jgi:hypothetical protein
VRNVDKYKIFGKRSEEDFRMLAAVSVPFKCPWNRNRVPVPKKWYSMF